MATSVTNLEDSVKQAVQTEGNNPQHVQQGGETQETQTTQEIEATGGETTEDQTQDVTEVDEFGLTAAEVAQARQMFAGLKGPQGTLIVDALARQAGYVKPPESKQEVKEQKKDIQAVLKEKLGPELAFLADKLGPAIQEILTEQLDEAVGARVKPINDTLAQAEIQKVQNEVNQGLAQIGGDYFKEGQIPANITGKMNELFKVILPTPGMTTNRYLSTIFHAACGELGITPVKNTVRNSKAKNHVPGRLNAARSGGEPQPIPGSKKLSLTDSIRLAMEAETNKK